VREEYWVQVFASSDEGRAERFLITHSDFSAHKIIQENGLTKVLVGPYQSYAEARASREYNNTKGAFVRRSRKSTPAINNGIATESEYKSGNETLKLQDAENKNAGSNIIITKILSLFTNQETKHNKNYKFIDFIETAENGQISHFSETPWGNDYDIMAKELYFAASGKECRNLILYRQEKKLPEMKTICKSEGSKWEKVTSINSY
jgi:hypothetical protein